MKLSDDSIILYIEHSRTSNTHTHTRSHVHAHAHMHAQAHTHQTLLEMMFRANVWNTWEVSFTEDKWETKGFRKREEGRDYEEGEEEGMERGRKREGGTKRREGSEVREGKIGREWGRNEWGRRRERKVEGVTDEGKKRGSKGGEREETVSASSLWTLLEFCFNGSVLVVFASHKQTTKRWRHTEVLLIPGLRHRDLLCTVGTQQWVLTSPPPEQRYPLPSVARASLTCGIFFFH